MKLGRNDPCPCRSGQKYKNCCLPVHERARAANTPLPLEEFDQHFQAVDAMSNHVLDLLQEHRHAEAEALCRRLIEEHADQPDGFERLGEVYAARGDRFQAALAFRRAGLFHRILIPANQQTPAWLFEQADRMDAGLELAWPAGDLDGSDEEK